MQDYAQLGGKGDLLVTVQKFEIWTYYLMVYAQTRIYQRERDV